MNKKMFILSACLLATMSSVVLAQDSVIYLDVRPNDSGSTLRTITGNLGLNTQNPFLNDTVNSGRRGQGQILYLEPKHGDGFESLNDPNVRSGASFPNFDGDNNASTGDLWIYMDVNDDASGTGDTISSVGLGIDTRLVGATMRNKVASMAVTLYNDGSAFNSITTPIGTGAGPWNNKVDGNTVAGSDPPDQEKIKAVRVPVDPGPVYNANLGITPRAQGTTPSYRLGKIRLTAGTRNCTARTAGLYVPNSSYDLYLSVNNLLITRVYNGPGDTVENVAFGYGALTGSSAPEAPTVSGSTDGAVSLVADARVIIDVKGDFNGDGNVTGGDVSQFNIAAADGTDNQAAAFAGDFNGNNTVTGGDIGSTPGAFPPVGSFFVGAQSRAPAAGSCP